MNSRNPSGFTQRWRNGVEGAAAVEFALVLPLLLVLSFGFIEVGRLFWTYHIATASVRDAARYGARLNPNCSAAGAPGGFGPLARQQIIWLARTGTTTGSGAPLVTGWINDGSVEVRVTCIGNGGGGGPVLGGVYSGLAAIPAVTVTATVPYNPQFGGLLGGLTMTSFTVSHREAWTE